MIDGEWLIGDPDDSLVMAVLVDRAEVVCLVFFFVCGSLVVVFLVDRGRGLFLEDAMVFRCFLDGHTVALLFWIAFFFVLLVVLGVAEKCGVGGSRGFFEVPDRVFGSRLQKICGSTFF